MKTKRGFGLGVVMIAAVSCSDINEWDAHQAALVLGEAELLLVSEPSISALPVARLAPNTVVWLEADARADVRKGREENMCRLRTNDGSIGWAPCRRIGAITPEEAEAAVLAEQQAFESTLRNAIKDAAVREIIESRIHPASDITRLWVVQPLEGEGASVETVVKAQMTGNLLGLTKHVVTVRVGVFLDLDSNRFSASRYRIEHVEIVGDERTEGMAAAEVADLLSNFAVKF